MKRLATLMLGSALLFGCASHTPNFIALSPELPAVTPQTSLEPALALQTLDTRTANFIVRFNEDGKAARLVSPAEPPGPNWINCSVKVLPRPDTESIPPVEKRCSCS
ncbi:hypothetical protein ACWAU3_17730 [Shewanella sp. JL219SE-S6]